MRYSLCTRTNDQDYTWHHSTPEPIKRAQEYSEFFDGGVGDIFAVLYRSPICDNALTFIISVPTTRRDSRGRVIRSMAMLQSGSLEEDEKLKSFYFCVLQTEDQDGLKNANSDIAFAIEEIVTTKGKSFERFNKVCAAVRATNSYTNIFCDKKAFPQTDIAARKDVAEALALISKDKSFFIAITYKKPDAVIEKFQLSIGAYVRIFSSQCTEAEAITTSPLKAIDRRYVIGGALLVIVICLLIPMCRTTKEEKDVPKDIKQATSNVVETLSQESHQSITNITNETTMLQ